jgi:hypothetical protein
MAEFVPLSPSNGNLRALCPVCGTLMHRRLSTAKLAALGTIMDVAILEADEPTTDTSPPSLDDHFANRFCKTPEDYKARSQNLGHEDVLTTFWNYGAVSGERQAEIMAAARHRPTSQSQGGGPPDLATIKRVLDHLNATRAQPRHRRASEINCGQECGICTEFSVKNA